MIVFHVNLQSAANSLSSTGAAGSVVGLSPKVEGDPLTVKTETPTVTNSESLTGESVSSTNNFSSNTSSALTNSQSSSKGESSALHWLADLASQKSKDDTKGECKKT